MLQAFVSNFFALRPCTQRASLYVTQLYHGNRTLLVQSPNPAYSQLPCLRLSSLHHQFRTLTLTTTLKASSPSPPPPSPLPSSPQHSSSASFSSSSTSKSDDSERVTEPRSAKDLPPLNELDLVEKFVRGSGPGGQKINKTAVCVVRPVAFTQIEHFINANAIQHRRYCTNPLVYPYVARKREVNIKTVKSLANCCR